MLTTLRGIRRVGPLQWIGSSQVQGIGAVMGEPGPRARVPWGTLLGLAVLAAVHVPLLRGLLDLLPAAPWPEVGVTVTAAFAAFLVMRWQQNFLWGLAAGLLLPLHPLYLAAVAAPPAGLVAETLVLVTLAASVYGFRLAFRPHLAWFSWLI